MCKKLMFILCLLVATNVAAQTSYDFRRNDDAATLTTQSDSGPLQAGTTRYREQFFTGKPGLFACSAAATGTAAVNIIAATAAVSHYVSQINCYNDSAVASVLTFKDDTTTFWSDIIGTTTLGTNRITINFPKPKKGTLNKPITVTPTTTATSTVCCANYLNEPNP